MKDSCNTSLGNLKISSLTLNVTNNCNLKCSYCFEKNKNLEFMSDEEAVNIFKIAYDNFKTSYQNFKEGFFVSFFGGEPFLNYSAMKAIMQYTHDNCIYDVSFGVTTNLTILTDEMIQDIDLYDLDIMISMDGLDFIHNRNRCNTYDTVVQNIKRLQKAGLNSLLSVRMTILPQDIFYTLTGVEHVVEDLSINVVHPCLVTDVAWDDHQLRALEKVIKSLFFLQKDYLSLSEYKDRNIFITAITKAIVTFYSFGDGSQNIPCGFGGNNSISVGCGGEIQPCHQRFTAKNLRKELCMGNILTGEVSTKCWGRIIPFTWMPESDKFSCDTCAGKKVCRGCCPSEGIDSRDSFLKVPQATCVYNTTLCDLIGAYGDDLLSSPYIRGEGLLAINFNREVMKDFEKLKDILITHQSFIPNLEKFITKLKENMEFIFPFERKLYAEELSNLYNIFKTLSSTDNLTEEEEK